MCEDIGHVFALPVFRPYRHRAWYSVLYQELEELADLGDPLVFCAVSNSVHCCQPLFIHVVWYGKLQMFPLHKKAVQAT